MKHKANYVGVSHRVSEKNVPAFMIDNICLANIATDEMGKTQTLALASQTLAVCKPRNNETTERNDETTEPNDGIMK